MKPSTKPFPLFFLHAPIMQPRLAFPSFSFWAGRGVHHRSPVPPAPPSFACPFFGPNSLTSSRPGPAELFFSLSPSSFLSFFSPSLGLFPSSSRGPSPHFFPFPCTSPMLISSSLPFIYLSTYTTRDTQPPPHLLLLSPSFSTQQNRDIRGSSSSSPAITSFLSPPSFDHIHGFIHSTPPFPFPSYSSSSSSHKSNNRKYEDRNRAIVVAFPLPHHNCHSFSLSSFAPSLLIIFNGPFQASEWAQWASFKWRLKEKNKRKKKRNRAWRLMWSFQLIIGSIFNFVCFQLV